MSSMYTKTISQYHELNRLVQTGQRVLFGSTTAAALPLYELQQSYDTNVTIYNRSIPGLSLTDALKCLDTCVFALKPSQIFLNLGEEDLSEEMDTNRQRLAGIIASIRQLLPDCTIDLVPLYTNQYPVEAYNRMLISLSKETGCHCLSLKDHSVMPDTKLPLQLFRQLVAPFTNQKPNFGTVWNYINAFHL